VIDLLNLKSSVDDPQDAQRDGQTRLASSSSKRLVVFLWCLVFQAQIVQVTIPAGCPTTFALTTGTMFALVGWTTMEGLNHVKLCSDGRCKDFFAQT
jgi:hypothetical protein